MGIKLDFVKWFLLIFVILHQLFILIILPNIKDMKAFCANILLSAVSLLLVLFVVEIILHTADKSESNSTCSEIFHHSRIPNTSSIYSNFAEEYTIHYDINSRGFRDREYNLTKCAGCYRIIAVGDSFTDGMGVEENDSFPKLLEAKLNKTEVINAGLPSNSAVLEYLEIKYNLTKLKPDMIMLNFDIGDVIQDMNYLKYGVFSGNELIAVNGCQEKKSKPFEIKTITLLNDVANKLIVVFKIEQKPARITRIEDDTLRVIRYEYLNDTVVNQDWNVTLGYLLKINELCKKNNITFVINTYAWALQIKPYDWKEGRLTFGFEVGKTYSLDPQNRIKRFCQENNITCLDLTPYFNESTAKNYYDYDMHWTKSGQKLASEIIYSSLQTSQKQ